MAAGPWFGSDGAFERFLRVPITYPVDTLERAVDRLHTAWLAIGGTRHQPRMLATTLV
jgi:bifunctional pyridoxal-dependent enzyme with beta-cystathionase and maltose regulon repressor activities